MIDLENNRYQIFDDLVSKDTQDYIEENLLDSNQFPWFYNENSVNDDEDDFDDSASVTCKPQKSKEVQRRSYFNSATKYCKTEYRPKDDFYNLDLKKLMTVSQSIRKNKRKQLMKRNEDFDINME